MQRSTTEMPNHNFYISNGEVLCFKCGFKRGEGSLVCQVENEQPAQGKYQISIELFSSGYLFYSRWILFSPWNKIFQQTQGKQFHSIELSSKLYFASGYLFYSRWYFRLEFYFSNNLKMAYFGLICICLWNIALW